MTAIVRPRIKEGMVDTLPDISQILLRSEMPVLRVNQPPLELDVARNGAALNAAPTPMGATEQNMQPFVRLAGLLPGEGATVVLRIEVLASGEVGEVEVDVSSGSRQVDQAAVAYARTLQWNAGRIDGSPHSVRIRWGVHLQA